MMEKNPIGKLVHDLDGSRISRRTFIGRAIGLGLSIPTISSLLAGCGQPPIAESDPAPQATATTAAPEATATTAASQATTTKVIFGAGGEPTTLDPHVPVTGIDDGFIRNIYDGLIDWAGKPGEYVPSLATEWEVASDNVTWTFKLREGVKFHDGNDFDAEAVKFNIDRALGNEIAWRWEPFVESAKVVDKYTIEIKSPKPHSGFLDYISWATTVFHSAEAFEKYGDDLKRNPVGTGPFIFDEWKAGEYVRLKRNPDYWGGAPAIEELEYRPISEYSSRVLALESGDVDQIVNVGVADVARLTAGQGLKVDTYPSIRNMYLMPNLSKDLIKKKEVRQALNYAVDRDALAKNVMAGLTTPSYSAFSTFNAGYKVPEPQYTYDPDKAKALLQAAGVPAGEKLVIMHTLGRYYGDREIAEALQSMFNAVGFDTELWQLEWPTYAQYMWSTGPDDPNVQKRDLVLTDFGAQDPNFAMYADYYSQDKMLWAPKGGNAYFNDTPELDKMIDAAWATVADEPRRQIFADMQDYIAEEALRVFIMEQSQVFASKAGLMGFQALPNQQWNWKKCYWA